MKSRFHAAPVHLLEQVLTAQRCPNYDEGRELSPLGMRVEMSLAMLLVHQKLTRIEQS